MYWEYGRNDKSFSYPQGRGKSPNVAVREGKWKLLVNSDGSRVELYDLDADPTEQRNIAEQNPDVAKDLTGNALAWRKALPGPPSGP